MTGLVRREKQTDRQTDKRPLLYTVAAGGLTRSLEPSQVALARFDDDRISKTGETDRQTDTRPLLYTVAAGGLVRTLELRQVALARLDDDGISKTGETDGQTDRQTRDRCFIP